MEPTWIATNIYHVFKVFPLLFNFLCWVFGPRGSMLAQETLCLGLWGFLGTGFRRAAFFRTHQFFKRVRFAFVFSCFAFVNLGMHMDF